MSKATSFIGEHTVELTIVPILKRILDKEFSFVVPLFPWMTREGGIVSKMIHEHDQFKIIGLYPRRPKLSISKTDTIILKISNQVIFGANSGKSLGIPIIAGLPLVRSFWELSDKPECLWLKLDFKDGEQVEYEIPFNKTYQPEKSLLTKTIESESEIIHLIQETAKTFNIVEAIEAFGKIKMDSMNLDFYSSFAYMGGYKPIYFLLK
ncbi:hypothetical protein GCM10027275_32190 [Rhabdobacter roseus]|uniref:Uncharacterized protein n=1 Tax=Rhabdobacter roseus TaxID=1655419 RepID=A0A840TYA2_9BACT|nr:hypothetical protein [Rhabdobacter roseus]MBB5285178.1 hypothetical protein [Rhabdobacter roseus]